MEGANAELSITGPESLTLITDPPTVLPWQTGKPPQKGTIRHQPGPTRPQSRMSLRTVIPETARDQHNVRHRVGKSYSKSPRLSLRHKGFILLSAISLHRRHEIRTTIPESSFSEEETGGSALAPDDSVPQLPEIKGFFEDNKIFFLDVGCHIGRNEARADNDLGLISCDFTYFLKQFCAISVRHP